MQPPSQTPPPQVPEPSPPLVASSPRKRLTIPIAIIAIVVVLVFALFTLPAITGGSDSGFTTRGKALTKNELRDGLKEIAAMSAGARAGDPSTIDLSAEPKTEIGRNFKALSQRSREVEDAFGNTLGGGGLETLLTPEILQKRDSRDESREKLERFRTATKAYFADTREIAAETYRLVAREGGPAGDADAMNAELDASEKAMEELIGITESILTFADRARPTLFDGKFHFISTADMDEYDALTKRFDTATEEFKASAEKTAKARQERLNRSLAEIGDRS